MIKTCKAPFLHKVRLLSFKKFTYEWLVVSLH